MVRLSERNEEAKDLLPWTGSPMSDGRQEGVERERA